MEKYNKILMRKVGEESAVLVGWSVQLPRHSLLVWQGELSAPLAAQGL